jgi:hypothetical protein
MQAIERARSVAAVLVSLVISLVLAGCAASPASPTPAAGPLLTVQTRGGECVDGPCGTTVVVARDGRVHQAAEPPSDLGTVWPETLASLEAAIAAADFAEIRSHPFTGECPTAYDGQEIVFEFVTAHGIERIASCEVAVDFGLPLFAAAMAALGPFVPFPGR